jgi:hypothetical protein
VVAILGSMDFLVPVIVGLLVVLLYIFKNEWPKR